jgi:hypothetical protein
VTGRSLRWLAFGLAAVTLAIVAIGLAASFAVVGQFGPAGPVFLVIFPALVLSLSLVGAFVAIRRPSNPIGWLLAASGLTIGVSVFGGTYVVYDHDVAGGRLPLVLPIAWLSSWLIVPTIGMLVIYVPLLFPTGRFLSPRWRALGIAGLVVSALAAISNALAPGPLTNADWLRNPFGLEGQQAVLSFLSVIGNAPAPLVFLAAVASVIVRYRRATPTERQQLKWFGSVAIVAVVAFAVSIPNNGPISDAAWNVGLISLVALPVAIGLAILRYGLWEIDSIVSRTVGYALVTGLLAAVFALLVVALDTILAPLTSGNGLAVAGSTLIVAALFSPLRRRIQALVDRRFNRARIDAERLVEEFGARLRDETDLDDIGRSMDAAVRDSLAPAGLRLWVRGERT